VDLQMETSSRCPSPQSAPSLPRSLKRHRSPVRNLRVVERMSMHVGPRPSGYGLRKATPNNNNTDIKHLYPPETSCGSM
jgi:hypothetical protein